MVSGVYGVSNHHLSSESEPMVPAVVPTICELALSHKLILTSAPGC